MSRHIRIPHLRRLNCYQLNNVWLEGNTRQWTLRVRGFGTKLATVTIPAGVAVNDVDRFFEAVQALVDTPAPETRRRKRKRK